MKFKTQSELAEYYSKCPNPCRELRDESGKLIAFSFEKKYTGHNHKLINVSLVKSAGKSKTILCTDDVFFEMLDDNFDKVQHVRKTREKITQFYLNGVKYKSTAPPGIGLWDIFPYKKFMRYTRSRFYNEDRVLRNGYFPGLCGSSSENISRYILNSDSYDLYDIDINHAYPSMWDYPLPYGAFYTREQWAALEKKPYTYMKFYRIVLKCIPNIFDIFVPMAPYYEYRHFDFLAHKTEFELIVSEYRLYLIDYIYGKNSYELKQEFLCGTKIYGGIVSWRDQQLREIEDKKAKGIDVTEHKRAVNMLVGMFGKRDIRHIQSFVQKMDNEYGSVLVVGHAQKIKEKCRNYLPLCMTIVDMCAVQLFYMLTDINVLPLSWNTDGAVVAVKPWIIPNNSKKMGDIRSKIIDGARFFECVYAYNRPIIVDKNNNVYNSNCMTFEKNKLIMEMQVAVNTRNGFNRYVNYIPLPLEKWKGFNLRQQELIFKLYDSKPYQESLKGRKLDEGVNAEFNKLANPYDENLNKIRHGVPILNPKHDFLFKKFYSNA